MNGHEITRANIFCFYSKCERCLIEGFFPNEKDVCLKNGEIERFSNDYVYRIDLINTSFAF